MNILLWMIVLSYFDFGLHCLWLQCTPMDEAAEVPVLGGLPGGPEEGELRALSLSMNLKINVLNEIKK